MNYTVPDNAVDLGHGHYLVPLMWDPDRGLNPQYKDLPEGPHHIGYEVYHPNKKDPTETCAAGIYIANEIVQRYMPRSVTWRLVSRDPLTLNPSLLCIVCGDHGFIREGKWVQA